MKKYRCILWDLDGTLTLSHPGIFNCMRYALEKMGAPEPTEQQLGLCIGPPLDWSFEQVFGLSPDDAQAAIKHYRDRYDTEGWAENDPVKGALQALQTLHKAGYKMALATSKPMHYAIKIIEKFGFAEYLTYEYEPLRPGYEPKKTDMIEKAIALVNNGAKLIGANPDTVGVTEKGIMPATGSLVAPIEIATGKKAYFVG